jgi:hypothetical protein
MYCRKYNEKKANMVENPKVFPNFQEWTKTTLTANTKGQLVENAHELWDMLIPSAFIARSYKSIMAYGNHYRIVAWPNTNNMVTYDFGVTGEFAHNTYYPKKSKPIN